MNIGYNNRWVRLIKDALFVSLAVWLVCRKNWLAIFVGLLGGYWYGRDAYFQIKALWQEKTFKPQEPKSDITITDNLNDAKEVEFEKE